MIHWQKLNKLPIAPPNSTTSQFLVSARCVIQSALTALAGPLETSIARHELVSDKRDDSVVEES